MNTPDFSALFDVDRRTLLLGTLFGLLGVSGGGAAASPIDPEETIVALPSDMKWTSWSGVPAATTLTPSIAFRRRRAASSGESPARRTTTV